MSQQRRIDRAFRVTIGGRGCLVNVDNEASGPRTECLRFLTTRFVFASTVEDATAAALTMINEELVTVVLNPAAQPYDLDVEEAYEDEEGRQQFGVGAGFT
jgi:hypothetical protein